MQFIDPDTIARVKEIDLLTYLQYCEPDELTRVSPNTYSTKTHSSLKISNGKWMWWSRGIGGKTALDFLVKVRGMEFTDAVLQIAAFEKISVTTHETNQTVKSFSLLPRAPNNDKVISYLLNRGISRTVIDHFINEGLIYQSSQRDKGKASLKKMLKSNSPVKVFELNDRDLKKFCEAAKKYGVMYHVLKDKNSNDKKCDIMVREEDAAKVNRIFERFSLGANNKAIVRNALAEAKKSQKEVPMRSQPGKTPDDKFVEMLFNNPPQKEKSFIDNPSVAKTEKSRPSEPTFGGRSNPISPTEREWTSSKPEARPSVRARLKEIKAEQNRTKSEAAEIKTPTKKKSKKKGVKDNVRS